jgi:hypothetical protein
MRDLPASSQTFGQHRHGGGSHAEHEAVVRGVAVGPVRLLGGGCSWGLSNKGMKYGNGSSREKVTFCGHL